MRKIEDKSKEEVVKIGRKIGEAFAEAGGISDFVREYTLASGGPYCDCGYKKKRKGNGRKRK